MATLTGYEFYIIVPAQATNEVLNPSVETGTTGYTAVGAGVSIARVSTQQRRGLWSLEVTTATGVASGAYYGTVSEALGTARTFSVDVYNATAGQAMRIYIADTSGNPLATTTFTSNGYWQRVSVTYTGTANTTRRLYVMRDAVASTAKFYVDGLYYSTVNGTYLDGDMKGFIKTAAEYRWNGTPHASTSWRSGQSRSGGTMLRIKDYAIIMTVLGLGMAAVQNIAVPTASGHSIYQNTITGDREFILNLAITGATLGDKQANRNALINAVRPDLVTPKQPILLRYQGVDAAGGDASEPVDIYAYYVDGLENEADNPGAEFVPLRFTQYLPFVSKSGDSGVGLGYTTSVANFANIGYRDLDGTWKAMSSGVTGGAVYAILPAPDGSVYVGGAFTSASGVATTANIAKYTPSTNAFTALPTGLNGAVRALAWGADGKLYVGGDFTATIGGTTLNHIGVWDGANWTTLGASGISATAGEYVKSLAFGPDGSLYAAGNFTTAGGVANTKMIAKWNGSAWSALGTGANNWINALVFGPDGTLYAGGEFTLAGGVTNTAHIAKWNGTAWSAMGTGILTTVYALAIGSDGVVYAGGDFASVSGLTIWNIARWNGSGWSSLGSNTGTDSPVQVLTVGLDGLLYAAGQFTTAGGVTMPEHDGVWNGSYWMPLDVKTQDAMAQLVALAFDNFGRLYIGGLWTPTTALSATVTVSSTGNVAQGAFPIVTFTGPGTVWQVKNYTTGQAIYFNNFLVLAGETATLDLRKGRVAFTSTSPLRSYLNGKGMLMPMVMTGSTLDWRLQPGANNVSAFMTGTTAASGIAMVWQDEYWSIDGAKR